MTTAGPLFDRLCRITLVVGKGGVGKTTLAAGLARRFADHGTRTLLLTTDPAATLADLVAAGRARGPATVAPAALAEHLDVRWPDIAGLLRDAFLAQWRDTIGTIIDRGTYLRRDEIDGLVSAALPGADEIFLLLALGTIIADDTPDRYGRIVVDTAPTGHTLRLLDLPGTFQAVVGLLDAMQAKHRFMVGALTHRYRPDGADAFIDEMRDRISALSAALADSQRTTAVVVTRAEAVVVAESARYLAALRATPIAVASVVVNVWTGSGEEHAAIDEMQRTSGAPWFVLPRVEPPPATIADAEAVVERLAPPLTASPKAKPRARPPTLTASPNARVSVFPPALFPKPLTIVAGKGGVGKTTVACALAIAAADAGERVLLVSTDPAPSLADALAQSITDDETPVAGVERLESRQIDAAAAFARLRDDYQERVNSLFDSVVANGLDVVHDRTILRDLLAFSPPGIDELYALSVLGDALEEARYSTIVVDPAPTGHLLRLLDMPEVALDWSHRLMRLLLEYQNAAPLGDTAEAVLAFARRTRRLDQRLHDPASSCVIGVALDEPLVRAETVRLARSVRDRGLLVAGILWNRAASAPEPLSMDVHIPQYFATNAAPLIGVEKLRRWSCEWTGIEGTVSAAAPL